MIADMRKKLLYQPRIYHSLDGEYFEFPEKLHFLISSSFSASDFRWAIDKLSEFFKKTGRIRWQISALDGKLPPLSVIVGSPEDKALKNICIRYGLNPQLLGEEGYCLLIDKEGIRISAYSSAGVFYAVQTLASFRDDNVLRGVFVADFPYKPFRAIHLPARGNESLPLLNRLVSEVLPVRRVNTLILQIDYAFEFKTHPEIREHNYFTRSQIRKLVHNARMHNVKVIPLLNCYGHQSWRKERIGALLRAYPEFNETPDWNIQYCANWCPSNPGVYDVVYDLIDELLEAFETNTIHLGMDEVFEFGKCPRCREMNLSPAEWFAKVVNSLYSHVCKKRNARMLMWGDRLVDGYRTPYNCMNGARNGTHHAIRMIPRDIILCDWHYHLHKTYPSVDQFERAGFDYVICGWKNIKAVNAFLKYAERYGKQHYLGVVATNWGKTLEQLHFFLENQTVHDDVRAAGECFYRLAEVAWTGFRR
jgi:hypothetical protein